MRTFSEEGCDDVVCFHGQESTQFVKPEVLVDGFTRIASNLGSVGKLCCSLFRDWIGVAGVPVCGQIVVERFEEFLQLESGFELKKSSDWAAGL